MRTKIIIMLLLLLAASGLFAQANGNMTQFGEKKILSVWGNHYERGYAQGFYLAPQIKEVFNDFYWTMYSFGNLEFYNMLWSYYMEHFSTDERMVQEVNGLVAGMESTGINMHHAGLGRELTAEDILLLNASYDMIAVSGVGKGREAVQLGCASLSSWGNATVADTLLAGASVITRLLDVSQNSAFINNALVVVHHPSETDEQKWISFTMPGFLGAITAISQDGVFAGLNVGSEHESGDYNGLSPIIFDLRKGLERVDFDQNGLHNPLDIFASIDAMPNLSASITHTLSENNGTVYSSAIERRYGAIANRLYNQSGNLPAHHLAVTNHFRVLSSGVCCSRYYNIQDSLYTNPQLSAKRQWQVLAGAAGLESNLLAVQYIPTTGNIIWAAATLAEPAYARPGITLSTQYLFTEPVSNEDEIAVPQSPKLQVYPNPARQGAGVKLYSAEGLSKVELFNLRGQKLGTYSSLEKAGQWELPGDWSKLPVGLYLLKASTKDGTSRTVKMVLR